MVLKDIVVMPGQAFELAFTGGPARNERTYFEYVSSDPEVASTSLRRFFQGWKFIDLQPTKQNAQALTMKWA